MTEKLFWLARRIWSVFWLGSGVVLLASLTSSFMTVFSVPTLAALAIGRAGGYVKDV